MIAHHAITIRMDTWTMRGHLCIFIHIEEVRKVICTTLLIILSSGWLDLNFLLFALNMYFLKYILKKNKLENQNKGQLLTVFIKNAFSLPI